MMLMITTVHVPKQSINLFRLLIDNMHAWFVYICNFFCVYHLSTVEGTCPDCENGYCSCYTDLECRCNYGYTGVNGSCEGILGDVDSMLYIHTQFKFKVLSNLSPPFICIL